MNITPTLNQLAFNLLNIIRNKSTSQDPISLRQIKFNILAGRSLLIRQNSNKNYSTDSDLIQTLKCVTVKLVDSSECPGITTGFKLLRTVDKIPSIIENYSGKLITRVGPVGINLKPFSVIPYARVPYFGLNKFTSKQIGCFFHNGYIYLIGDDITRLKKINIQAVFENPEDVAEFTDCETGEKCYSDDLSFPIKYSMVPILTQMVIEKYLGLQTKALEDKSNDGKTDFK
jgi:hypothetical protein